LLKTSKSIGRRKAFLKTSYLSLGITLHTITKIESGATPDLRIETVKKIADALDISVDDLLKE